MANTRKLQDIFHLWKRKGIYIYIFGWKPFLCFPTSNFSANFSVLVYLCFVYIPYTNSFSDTPFQLLFGRSGLCRSVNCFRRRPSLIRLICPYNLNCLLYMSLLVFLPISTRTFISSFLIRSLRDIVSDVPISTIQLFLHICSIWI